MGKTTNQRHGYTMVLAATLVASATAGPLPDYELVDSPSSENFNGIASTTDGALAIAVGNAGAIVHFENEDDGTVMPSPTDRDLFDVFIASPDFAVATGREILLLWDGTTWEIAQTGTADRVFTGTWISPEQDVVLYGIPNSQFAFVCPFEPGATQQGFCRTFGRPMLTACGQSGDIKLLNGDGDFFNIDNGLADLNGVDPIFDQATPLGLTAAWIPDDACLPGPFPPRVAYAIRNRNQFWKFDGSQWIDMLVDVPPEQTLAWLDGTQADGLAVAVGFKPNMNAGFDGVLWNSDGATWTEDLDLPVGTPGLMDIAVSEPPFVDTVFASGFETLAPAPKLRSRRAHRARGGGDDGNTVRRRESQPEPTAELEITKSIVGSTPTMPGQTVRYRIEIRNDSQTEARDVHLIDQFGGIDFASGDCGSSEVATSFGTTRREATIATIAAGATFSCEMVFTVTAQSGQGFTNIAIATPGEDYALRFRRVDDSINVILP